MKRIIGIMNLDDIVTPDISKMVDVLYQLIYKKCPDLQPLKIKKAIHEVIQENKNDITDLTLGEENFRKKMILSLRQKTRIYRSPMKPYINRKLTAGITLSPQELNEAWLAAQPNVNQYKPSLEQAIHYHQPPNQELVFISDAYPRKILYDLYEANILDPLLDKSFEIKTIKGIPLHASDTSGKSKAELLDNIITKILENTACPTKINFFSSLELKPTPLNIKYIRPINPIRHSIQKDELNNEIEKKLAQYNIGILDWNKNEKSLAELLNDSPTLSESTASRLHF